jgi:hypothetical protein
MGAFFEIIFAIWCLFMLGGTAVLMTYMMWHTLRDIFKGEW